MSRTIISAEALPTASVEALTQILERFLLCSAIGAEKLAKQSHAAIQDLPDDSRPCTYDGLVDVARFCLEEEPGWSHDECIEFLSQYPRLDVLIGENQRLSQLCEEYETRFPGLRYISSKNEPDIDAAISEVELSLQHYNSTHSYEPSSDEWRAELDHVLGMMWDSAVDRASALHPGPVTTEPDTFDKVATSPESNAAPSKPQEERGDDEPFLSLSSFRALAVTSPCIEKFFEHDLPKSFRLDEVQWSSSGGAFAWHAAPVVPRNGQRGPDVKSTKSSAGTVSIASTLLHGNTVPLHAETPVSYSRDITSGARGKVVGFLGGLFGEEGKTRIDALADQVALRLQAHSVRGPIPSFAQEPAPEPEKKSRTWRNAWMQGKNAASNVVSEARSSTFSGRLANVFGVQSATSPEKVSSSENEDTTNESCYQDGDSDSRTALRGSDLAREGPEAAVATLRAANETLLQERSAFVIDETPSADNTMGEGEDEADHDVEGLDALIAGDAEPSLTSPTA